MYDIRPQHNSHKSSIPIELLEKLRIMVVVPRYVDLEADSFSLAMRLRADDSDDSRCARVRATGFTLDIVQSERLR